jgi:hypothetical protein
MSSQRSYHNIMHDVCRATDEERGTPLPSDCEDRIIEISHALAWLLQVEPAPDESFVNRDGPYGRDERRVRRNEES